MSARDVIGPPPFVLMAAVHAMVRLGRFKFLPYSAVLYGFGATIAMHRGVDIEFSTYVLGQLFVWCAHLMTHYCNEYFDLEADRANRAPTPMTGGSRVLVEGLLPPIVSLSAALVLLMLALWLLMAIPAFEARAIGCGMLALAWFYTAPPFRLNYRGLGEITVALVLNVATPLLGYQLQTGSLDLRVGALLLPGAIIQVVRMVMMNLMDYEGDLAVGKTTLVTLIGREHVKHLYVVGHAVGYGLAFLMLGRVFPATCVVLLALTLPLSIWQGSRLWQELDRDVATAGSMAFWASTHVALVVVATSLGLGLDRALGGVEEVDRSLLFCAAIPLMFLCLIVPQARKSNRARSSASTSSAPA